MECLSDGNLTGDRPILVYLVHHRQLPPFLMGDGPMLANCVDLGHSLGSTCGVGAVFALDVSCAAKPSGVPIGLVRGTGLVSDIVLFDPLVGKSWVAPMAAPIGLITGE